MNLNRLPWILTIIVVAVVVALVATAWFLLEQKDHAPVDKRSTAEALIDEKSERACGLPSAESVAAHELVQVKVDGFAPAEVAIKVGQTVRWTNADKTDHRIISDEHPLHDTCFGLDSKVLHTKDTFGYTFTKPGEWGYHDELNLSFTGRITVTE